ncbi:MAG TPA: hypothetical protein VHM02_12430, partial [Thermoanaerobaculia bacterium]|nr:hypothetical protein [Thermoanaerobaculia bacterium]
MAGAEEAGRGRLLTVEIAPADAWDAAEGPVGHELSGGRVSLFRPGSFVPELVVPAGTRFRLPPGRWLWLAEAEGWVSSFTSSMTIPDEVLAGERSLLVPVVPACHLTASAEPSWSRVERVDVVSLDEHAVYPLVWRHRREAWVPAGRYLAYSVAGRGLAGVSAIGSCAPGERRELALPTPPPRDRQAFVVTLTLPEGLARDEGERLLALLEDPLAEAGRPPVPPDAAIWQGGTGSLFFLGVAADRALSLAARHPLLRSAAEPVEPLGGSVREMALGALRARRDYEVRVDYRPSRAHREARLELYRCGRERSGGSDVILADRCRERVAEVPLQAGLRPYVFPALDDGQYLLSAAIDDERVPGLGRDVAPYLDPEDDLPPAVETHPLEEHEVYGHLLRGGEAVPGEVRLAPWSPHSAVPGRTFSTDDDLLYHLFYFGRYLTAGESQHLPEPLRDRDPAEMPGLYCCSTVTACTDAGLCRSFNVHSTYTGGGRMDLELAGDETVDLTVLDAATGAPLPDARVLVEPGPAFHFDHGEVIWAEALGMEPEVLEVGGEGRVRWAPPGPGAYRTTTVADGYEGESRRIEIAAGERVELELRLRPETEPAGAWLGFADGAPASDAALLAFADDGRPRPECRTRTGSGGRIDQSSLCADASYLVVHPRAALIRLDGGELAGRAGIEIRERPGFPLRLRAVDPDGRPLAGVPFQVRVGDLTITPNQLLAAADAAILWERTNAAGEIVLFGVDPGAPGLVEVAPWGGWEGDWSAVTGADLAACRP